MNTAKDTPALHMVCNAHLDPVWLWEWEEGAAEAISTFRTAADLCEQFEGFVFNHNEVILYEWVREYEPTLFARIQQLVRAGRWHIMGGWYLQPDCNMPAGESFVRQVLAGRRYFARHFDAYPTTAINFDPFGHTRGLVQVMAKAGYDGYVFCRPGPKDLDLPDEQFHWVGFDGSSLRACRVASHYNSPLGKAHLKVAAAADQLRASGKQAGIVLWGVGNHGGGPSRFDLAQLARLIDERDDVQLLHSTPERYFDALAASGQALPRFEGALNPWGVGCYTSMLRLKQKHRALENQLFMVEKIASAAAAQGLIDYPESQLAEAQRDLMFAQFHDILPGSAIPEVEESSLRLMDHGLEKLSRVRARAFFALASGQPQAPDGQIPVLVYNPHPHAVRTTVECEFQLADQNWSESWTGVQVTAGRKKLPTQVEKESSNLTLDWRKKVVFEAELAPSSMNRFDCVLQTLPSKPQPTLAAAGGVIDFDNGAMAVRINTRTGLIDRYRIDGVDYLKNRACQPLVVRDDEDPWGMHVRSFRDVAGAFKLASRAQAAHLAGVKQKTLPAVRVVEDGPVRAVVEAILTYENSSLIARYALPRRGTQLGVELRVHWQEKDRFLKLALPTPWKNAQLRGQTAFGTNELPTNGDEACIQQWAAVVSEADDAALTVINDGTYGCDYRDADGLRLSVLRSAAYAAHPIKGRPLVPQDRATPRIDQGERVVRFWIDAGRVRDRLTRIDREALAHNQRPAALSFFPSGSGDKAQPGPRLSDAAAQLAALKRSEDGQSFIARLFNPTDRPRTTTLSWGKARIKLKLGRYELRTLRLDPVAGTASEADLLESTR